MLLWLLLIAAVLAVTVLAVSLRQHPPSTSTPPNPAKQPPAKIPRVAWPPGYSNSRPIRTVHKPNALFLIEKFPTRAAALDFLRNCEVRDKGVYVIAENPEQNLGRDLIMIFEETDGSFVEIGKRSPLPTPIFSETDCARCRHTVLKAADPLEQIELPSSTTSVMAYHSLDENEMQGTGFKCQQCGALACAHCYRSVPQKHKPDGGLDLRCWLCNGSVGHFTEESSDITIVSKRNSPAQIEHILIFYLGNEPSITDLQQILDLIKQRFHADTDRARIRTYDAAQGTVPEDELEDLALAKIAALEGQDLTTGAVGRTVTYPVKGLGVVAVTWRDNAPRPNQ